MSPLIGSEFPAHHLELTEQLATRGHLRDSLTPTTAADILYALAGPANRTLSWPLVQKTGIMDS